MQGPRLRKDCGTCLNKNRETPEPIGNCLITKAHALPSEYVFHTVGPSVDNFLTEEHVQGLINCYKILFKCCC